MHDASRTILHDRKYRIRINDRTNRALQEATGTLAFDTDPDLAQPVDDSADAYQNIVASVAQNSPIWSSDFGGCNSMLRAHSSLITDSPHHAYQNMAISHFSELGHEVSPVKKAPLLQDRGTRINRLRHRSTMSHAVMKA